MIRRLAVILSMLTTVFVGFGLIIPVLPLMVAGAGAKPYHLGMMLAVYSAVSLVVSPWWGRLSDKIGRKPVLIVGLFGFAAGFVTFGLSAHQLWLMYLARIIGGGFSGAVTATAMAYVADVTGVEDRTRGMAFAGMSIGVGFILGPAMGGILSSYGASVPFFVAGGLAVLNAVWGIVSLRESLSVDSRRDQSEAGSRWQAFLGPLKYMYLLDFVAQFSIAALEGCFQYYQMAKIGASAREIGWMFAVSGVVAGIVQGGIVQRYVKHGREVPTLYIGLVLSGIGLFTILGSINFWTAALFMTLFAASNTVLKPTLTSVITKQTTVGQGLASGLLSSMDSLARIIGPLLATVLYEVHMDLPFIVTGAIVLLSCGLVAAYSRQRVAIHDRIVTEQS